MIPKNADAAAPLTFAESWEKNPAIAKVMVFILGDCNRYSAN